MNLKLTSCGKRKVCYDVIPKKPNDEVLVGVSLITTQWCPYLPGRNTTDILIDIWLRNLPQRNQSYSEMPQNKVVISVIITCIVYF